MKLILSVTTICLVFFLACNKDKFTTAPQITIKSIAPKTVSSGDIISLKGKYTDAEGDIDTVFIVYKWYNGATIVRNDTFKYPFSTLNVPDKTREADINVILEYNTNNTGLAFLPGVPRDTTATLGLMLKDKAANKSNYAESDPIRLKKP